ncbi:MAG: cohesin domain-containing protein [Saprospiraceae bacterium]
MTKNIVHAIKKFLRIGVVVVTVTTGTINSSAQGSIPGLCSASCNSQLNTSLDGSGYALIDPAIVWEEGYNGVCFPLLDQIVVEVVGSSLVNLDVTQNGHTVATTSALLDCSFIGQNIEYNLVKYYSDGTVNSCWGNILIEDKMKPSINCSDLTINCTENIDPYQLANTYNNSIPTTTDNCGIPTLTFQDSTEDYNCLNPDFLKKITRIWTATDGSGNQQTCTQNIFIEKAIGTNIQFPTHLNNITAPALNCPDADLEPTNTGYPTLYGVNIGDQDVCNFSSYYQDQMINTCGGSFKILRNWTVVDWCTNEIFLQPQIIKVLDEVAPTITCPTIPTIGTVSNSCTGNMFLPEAIISDACSNFSVTTETPLGIINGNGGSVIGLELGTHTIIYRAEDECGNISSCETTVTVIDNIAPTTICDEHTTISLINDGTALAYANIFDDGSFDNCEIANLEVRRMDNPNCPGDDASSFGEYVEFSCCDMGSTVMVELRVTDVAGNSNYCMIDVQVQDKLDPVIFCPPAKIIECQEDFTDLSLTGEATATDNCAGVLVTYNDIVIDINQCGVGEVTRVWTATDAEGRTSSCIQKIYLINENPFEENDIIFPLNYDTDVCGGGNLLPENLPSVYGVPMINDDACDVIGLNYEDQVLQISSPACYKILRKWTVIDWCAFDPNYAGTGQIPGQWTHVQVIKVTDNVAPVFTSCPTDKIIDNYDADCGTTYVSLQVEATDCSNNIDYFYEIDKDNDGSIEITGNGNDASGAFDNGNYTITFAVTDGCGNTNYCSFLFTVKDAKKPTPVCINGLSTDLMVSSGMVQIWASDFETGSSFDNCTAYDDLKFSFSSDVNDTYRAFDCDNLGTQTIEFWVTDLEGNQDYCSTNIVIQDNNGVCPNPTGTATIEGIIQDEMGEVVENVTIEVSGSNALPSVTGTNGNFIFPSLPAGNAYSVSPKKDMNHSNGVTTYDLVLISKHILGTQLLNSPYKAIAADANKSGSISTLDIVQLRKMILHIDDQLQYNTSWRFVAADFVFTYPNNPFADNFPEVKDIANLSNDEAINFIGIKIGDVNNTAMANNILGTEIRNEVGILKLEIGNANVKANELIQIDFKAKDFKQMIGFQFTLNFDTEKMDFEEVKSKMVGLNESNFGLTFLQEGKITVSWDQADGLTLEDETILFSLVFYGKSKTTLAESIHISSSKTTAEAYSQNNPSGQGGTDVMNVELFFNGYSNTTTWNKLFQNQPNPATTSTTIPFELVLSETVILKVSDLNGRVIKVIKGDFEKGYNEINLINLTGNGIFYYQLETSKKTLIKKMILVNK